MILIKIIKNRTTQRRNPNAPNDKNASNKQITTVKMIYPLIFD